MIRTERLLLRQWRESDIEPFAAINADPDVMRYFPAPYRREESEAAVERYRVHIEEHGWSLWAVEVPGVAACIGCLGLAIPKWEAPFTPAVEIGWRLAKEHWGRGYATEGARAALAYGFDDLGLSEILSFTVPANTASRRVMEKIGMVRDPSGDFDHPRLPEGHALRRHVLYRATNPVPSLTR
jgi:RimJ/RimL family protein N-acetyltransferase